MLPDTLYDFRCPSIDGTLFDMKDLQGKVVLVVNTASQCALTPQYRSLEELYRRYKDRGLVILGFPCNQFGAQEPGNEEDIQQFCDRKYRITFPMFSKIDVFGPRQAPLYAWLTKTKPGWFGVEKILWNFTKFLIDRHGQVVGRFGPGYPPSWLVRRIEQSLDAKPTS
ncbi:MAG: glutathione peroxidase [Pirellulaceae bacterium]|jgi:glutathione peroxidase